MRIGAWAAVVGLLGCGSGQESSVAPGVGAVVPSGSAPSCIAKPRTELSFEKKQLDTVYRVEGVGAFDVNGDGRPDIVTDQYWYDARDMSPHEVREPHAYDPASQYALGFGAYPADINGDGCTDIVAPPHPMDPFYWYENPCGGALGRWKQHTIAEAGIVGLETPFAFDLFGDGSPVFLASDSREGQSLLGFYDPKRASSDGWTMSPISAPKFPGGGGFVHGIGAGDLDGDGDLDVLTAFGWFENTGDRTTWLPHLSPNPFPGADNACSRMWTYDLDCDGLADVVCSRPHTRGIHWYQQRKVGTERTFVDHVIDESVTQMHALRLHDLDGDGVPELVTGTRWCAHCGAGSAYPDPEKAYLVYYSIKRVDQQLSFERHVIDESSGVGVAFDIADIDGDGKPDIVTANKKGLFYFRQR